MAKRFVVQLGQPELPVIHGKALPLHLVFSPLFVPPRRFAGRARHCTISCSTVSIYAFLRFVKRFCKFFRQTWLCQPAGHEKAAAGAAARHTARRNAVRKAYSRGAEKIPFCTAFAGASRRRRRTARRRSPPLRVLREGARQQRFVVAGKHAEAVRLVGDVAGEPARRGDDAHGKAQRLAAALQHKVEPFAAVFPPRGAVDREKAGLGRVVPRLRLRGQAVEAGIERDRDHARARVAVRVGIGPRSGGRAHFRCPFPPTARGGRRSRPSPPARRSRRAAPRCR